MKDNFFAEYHKSLNPPLKIIFWISQLVWTENGSHTEIDNMSLPVRFLPQSAYLSSSWINSL